MTMTSVEEERFLKRRKQPIQNSSSSSLSLKNQRDSFFTTFRARSQELSTLLLNLEAQKQTVVTTSQQRHELWSTLSFQYSSLNKLLITYSTTIALSSTTDIRILQDELDALLHRLLKVKETILYPRSKFTFRRYHEWKRLHGNAIRATISTDKMKESEDSTNEGVQSIASSHNAPSSSTIIQEKSNESIRLQPLQTTNDMDEKLKYKQCLVLKKLKHCNIQIDQNYQTFHLLSCSDCTITCQMPISSSIFVHDCQHCNIYITSSKQLRIHDSNQCNFLICHITTGPIIENCQQLFFSNDWNFSTSHPSDSCTANNSNNQEWKNIKDFSWLSVLKPSPNFQIKEVQLHQPQEQERSSPTSIDDSSIRENDASSTTIKSSQHIQDHITADVDTCTTKNSEIKDAKKMEEDEVGSSDDEI